MHIYGNALEMIGRTPMLELSRMDTGPCRLFTKLELNNPAHSVKDRIALTMIEEAEKRGDLKPGDTLVEGTAGNTGLGLALVARQKGYPLVLVIPDKMSPEKISSCRAMGAEVILTRSDVQKGHPEYYQDMALRIAEERGGFFVNQFGNPDNALAHERTTAPEIFEQLDGKVDAVVVGVGSSGTVTGLGRWFRKHAPHVELIVADPEGSVLTRYINEGELGEAGSWLVEGIGEDFIPDVCDLSFVKKAYAIPDREAFLTAREFLSKEGIMAGSSSGTLLAAALRYCREQTEAKNVVTLACDTGNRYISRLYNDFWMWEQGFIERPEHGDLRDLISRPHEDRVTVAVSMQDTVATAHKRMRDNGFSQLPVVDGDRLMGGVNEGDLIRGVRTSEQGFQRPIGEVMNTGFPSVAVDLPLSQLAERLEIDTALAVVRDSHFLGMVTRSDLLGYLGRGKQIEQ
jgi:cystathionine beta-synthase